MANEFIIKNGAQVTGSLSVSGSITATSITADSIDGNITYNNISASGTITANKIRLDPNGYIYFNNDNENFPFLGYNVNSNRIVLRGSSLNSGTVFQVGVPIWVSGESDYVSASAFYGNIDYSYIENVPGFVDSTGTITENSLAVFAENATGLPINLPFSLPLYNDGNPTVRAFEGLSYTSSNLTVNNSITLTPTQSAAPTFDGVDGQIVVGMRGAAYAIYVWLEGGWRSGSLT